MKSFEEVSQILIAEGIKDREIAKKVFSVYSGETASTETYTAQKDKVRAMASKLYNKIENAVDVALWMSEKNYGVEEAEAIAEALDEGKITKDDLKEKLERSGFPQAKMPTAGEEAVSVADETRMAWEMATSDQRLKWLKQASSSADKDRLGYWSHEGWGTLPKVVQQNIQRLFM